MNYQEGNACLEATDNQPILMETFLMEGKLTDLQLYPQELRIVNKEQSRRISFQFGQSYAIIQGKQQNPEGIQLLIEGQRLVLERDFWPKAKKWEDLLLKYLIRSNFSSLFSNIQKIEYGKNAVVSPTKDKLRKEKQAKDIKAKGIKTKQQFAFKRYSKEYVFMNGGKTKVENEIKMLKKLDQHPSFIKYYGTYQSEDSIYLAMEYFEGMTLQHLITQPQFIGIETKTRLKIIKGLLMGLKQLSRLHIAHGDIKPANIMLSPDCQRVKIIDFGLASYVDQGKQITISFGTPSKIVSQKVIIKQKSPQTMRIKCRSPQMLRIKHKSPQIMKTKQKQKQREGLKVSVEQDMFRLGTIYYHLIYGFEFKGNPPAGRRVNRHQSVHLVNKPGLAVGELQLLAKMLQNDSASRITPEEALKHTLFIDRKQSSVCAFQSLSQEPTNSSLSEEM